MAMWLCSASVQCIRVHGFHFSVAMPRARKRKVSHVHRDGTVFNLFVCSSVYSQPLKKRMLSRQCLSKQKVMTLIM